MERFKIKCPVCGNEVFIAIEKPYREGFETYIEDFCKYYACCNCGLVLRFAKKEVESKLREEFLSTEEGKRWKELDLKRSNLQSKLSNLARELDRLESELNDDRRSVARDRQIKEEIKTINQKIPVLNKEIDALLKEMDSIKK